MKIAVGSDHAGFELKELVRPLLEDGGHEVVDVGQGARAVDLEDQHLGRVGLGVGDGVGDEVHDDRVEPPRDLHHRDEPVVASLLGACGAREEEKCTNAEDG